MLGIGAPYVGSMFVVPSTASMAFLSNVTAYVFTVHVAFASTVSLYTPSTSYVQSYAVPADNVLPLIVQPPNVEPSRLTVDSVNLSPYVHVVSVIFSS